MQKKQKDDLKSEDGSDNGDDATTRVGAAKEASSDSEGEGGVLSKKDLEVFQQYKERKNEVDRRKYTSQNGWFIP